MRVLLGISGGIAAFKAPEIVRRLRERQHDVRCVLTQSATAFVTPLTLEVLTGHAVYREDYLQPTGSGEELHISLARWAEALLVAPATAHTLARLALGLADDFLSTTALAFGGPLVAAPAMHSVMWDKPTVRDHVSILRNRGALIVGPVLGPLASGEVGLGRMAAPADIVAAVEGLAAAGPLRGRTVVVTAGPTHEPIDPVRFLTNRSSGKMGFELAAEAARRGARTVLIAGPVSLSTPPGVERIDVTTGLEMLDAVEQAVSEADLLIMTAAVADFRPRSRSAQKIKRQRGVPEIALEPNPDILAAAAQRAPQAVVVGFAAETEDLMQEAERKLRQKRVDFLVANDVSRSDIGFSSDLNEVTVLDRAGARLSFPRQAKRELAAKLLDLFSEALPEREHRPAKSSG